jgi:DNA-directed RNA polymerase specialized sigma24 family protein
MAAADGDRGAVRRSDRFDALFDAHYADVLAFTLRRTASRAEAEDIAAETFAVVWRRSDSVRDPGDPMALRDRERLAAKPTAL